MLVVIGPEGKSEIVNYRVKGDLYIVDLLFERGALLLDADKTQRKAQCAGETHYRHAAARDDDGGMSDGRAGSTGRRHRSRTEADQLAAEYEASGLTRPEFCLHKNMPMKTLGRYIARYRRQNAAQRGAQRWVAVEVAGAGGEAIRSR